MGSLQQGRSHQNGQMGNQRHGLVVGPGITGEPVGTHRLGQVPHLGQGLGIRGGRRGGHPGPTRKQAFHTSLHPSLGRTRHRMAGHKAGHPAVPTLEHRCLHRTHIGDHRLGGQGRHELLSRIEQPIQWQGQHHQATTSEHPRIGAHIRCQLALTRPLGGGGAMDQGPHLGALRH